MADIKAYEMFEVMPVYWTDGLTAILLNSADLSVSADQNQKAGQKTDNTVLPKRVLIEVMRVIRDTAEARNLKNLYSYQCQVCGKALPLATGFYSEVHHLQPLGADHKGPDNRANMIVVCPNHHALFDEGAIAIEPETCKVIDYQGKEIGFLFSKTDHRLEKEYLEYHFKKRFKRI
jgi:putative restriction endonuclease